MHTYLVEKPTELQIGIQHDAYWPPDLVTRPRDNSLHTSSPGETSTNRSPPVQRKPRQNSGLACENPCPTVRGRDGKSRDLVGAGVVKISIAADGAVSVADGDDDVSLTPPVRAADLVLQLAEEDLIDLERIAGTPGGNRISGDDSARRDQSRKYQAEGLHGDGRVFLR